MVTAADTSNQHEVNMETKIVHIQGHGDFELKQTQFVSSACSNCHFGGPAYNEPCRHPTANAPLDEVCGLNGYFVKVGGTASYPDNDSQLGAGNG